MIQHGFAISVEVLGLAKPIPSRSAVDDDSDCYNDDLPYWTRVLGRPHLVVPYGLVVNARAT